MADKPQRSTLSEGEIQDGAAAGTRSKPSNLGRQLLGAGLGALVGQLFVWGAPSLGVTVGNPARLVLWAAAIGGLLASFDGYVKAGAIITRREGKEAYWLNFFVAFLMTVLLFGLVVGFFYLVQYLLS